MITVCISPGGSCESLHSLPNLPTLFHLAYKLSSFTLSLPLPPSLVRLQKEQLHIAIMDYLNHHSRDKKKLERLQLVALKFEMFRELAKVKERQTMKDLKKIKPITLGKDVTFLLPPWYRCAYLQGFI